VDYATLNRLAIDYSDAIAISSENIDAELIEYARQSGKPILEYPGEENYAEAYKAFYESL
jgi:starch synthase